MATVERFEDLDVWNGAQLARFKQYLESKPNANHIQKEGTVYEI